jgi:hypothetical protein
MKVVIAGALERGRIERLFRQHHEAGGVVGRILNPVFSTIFRP